MHFSGSWSDHISAEQKSHRSIHLPDTFDDSIYDLTIYTEILMRKKNLDLFFMNIG